MSNNQKGTEWFKEKVRIYHGNNVEILSEYINGITPVDFVYHCPNGHGDTYSTVNGKNICKPYFLPCKKCQSIRKSESGKKRTNDKVELYNKLKKYCEDRGGKLLSIKYINMKTVYEYKCENPEHPSWKCTADALMNGNHWCPYCSGRFGNFDNEIKNIIESKNGEMLSEYVNQTTYVNVRCKEHDYTWGIIPMNLKKGKWCPICYMGYTEKIWWEYLDKNVRGKNNLDVRVQYGFDDLMTNNQKLKFDFAITDKQGRLILLLEIDDEEHRDNHDNSQVRLIARERDYMKNDYCKEHNIILLRYNVPYRLNNKWEYSKYYNHIDTYFKNNIKMYL